MADDRKNESGKSDDKPAGQDKALAGGSRAGTADPGPCGDLRDDKNLPDWGRFAGLISVLLAIGAILPIAQEYIRNNTIALILSVLLVAAAVYLIATASKLTATASKQINRLRQARDRTINLRLPGLVAVLALAVLIGFGAGSGITIVFGRHAQPDATRKAPRLLTVQMAGSSEFFYDTAVKNQLRSQGFVVNQTPLGSLQVCHVPSLVQRYEITKQRQPARGHLRYPESV